MPFLPCCCCCGNYRRYCFAAAGTTSASQYPCPAGTFNNITMLVNASQCAPCSPGAYCGTAGLAAPTASCAAGYYCIQGASSATPAAANNR